MTNTLAYWSEVARLRMMASVSGIAALHCPRHLKVEGSSPAPATGTRSGTRLAKKSI